MTERDVFLSELDRELTVLAEEYVSVAKTTPALASDYVYRLQALDDVRKRFIEGK